MKLTYEDLLQYADAPQGAKHRLSRTAQERITTNTLQRTPDFAAAATRRRPLRAVLIAAAVIAVLAITAGAVGLSLHQSARNSLGITDPEHISGYTEYALEEAVVAPEPTQDPELDFRKLGGAPELVAAMSGDDHMTVFLRLPGVTQDMMQKVNDPDYSAYWQAEGINQGLTNGNLSYVDLTDGDPVEYDPDTETVLLRFFVTGLSSNAKSVKLSVMFQDEYQLEEHNVKANQILYDEVEIPVTESVSLHADVNKTVTHPNLASFKAELLDVEVTADSVVVSLKTPSYKEFMAALGEDAWAILGNTCYGEPVRSEEEAQYCFRGFIDMLMNPYERMTIDPNSPSSPEYVMQGATLNLSDGSVIELAKLERIYAGEWIVAGGGSCVGQFATGEWSFESVYTKALDLDAVESITIAGETYPLTKE